MSPSSVCYKLEPNGDVVHANNIKPSGVKSATTSFQFGIRSKLHHQAEKVSVSALKVCKDSHRIRKPPLPLPRPIARPTSAGQPLLRSPIVQYRAPIIIHTYSPEVIHTQPDDFMSLVQKLTGSCDTRHRLKRKKAFGSKKSPRVVANDRAVTATAAVTAAVEALQQQQGLGLNCGSPSSSEEDSATVVRDGLASVKQSNSPRGPLSNFEFDNTFASSAPSSNDIDNNNNNNNTGAVLNHVKPEPVSTSDSGFNFFTGLKPLPKPDTGAGLAYNFHFGGEINSPLPSPGFLSPGLFAGLPELSPGTAAWSQQFLDCLNASPQIQPNQPPLALQRQRAYNNNNNGANAPASEGTMVALENIQAFMLT